MPYKNKKTQYRLYDYTYIALWNSIGTTAFNIECKVSKIIQRPAPNDAGLHFSSVLLYTFPEMR
jgi:hypothetical protein